MPKAKEITDWRPYLSLTQSDKEEQEETGLSSTAQIDNFTFEF